MIEDVMFLEGRDQLRPDLDEVMRTHNTRTIFDYRNHWVMVPEAGKSRDADAKTLGDFQALRVTMQDPAKYQFAPNTVPRLRCDTLPLGNIEQGEYDSLRYTPW
ncbi:hypothetical protein N7490_007736 [Penicillium lividum]|nr:hypothetical protein N7490_007736 [Penicillium lividum]